MISFISWFRVVKLELFRPDLRVESVLDIDLPALKEAGFECLMLDLDNTLLPWKSSDVPEEVRQWVQSAKALGIKLCIVSNTHYPRRLTKIAEELGIPSMRHALKPRRRGFMRACELLDSQAKKSVVVGDQLLTDILGGNRAGMYTILVKPMHHKEFIGTKISRIVEFCILALLARNPEKGTKLRQIQSETQDTK